MIRTVAGAALVVWGGVTLFSRGAGAVVEEMSEEVAGWLAALDDAVSETWNTLDDLNRRRVAVSVISSLVKHAYLPEAHALVLKAVQKPHNDALATKGWELLSPESRAGYQDWMLWRAELLGFNPPPPELELGPQELKPSPMPMVALVAGGALILSDRLWPPRSR